jgi:hypothetical protein
VVILLTRIIASASKLSLEVQFFLFLNKIRLGACGQDFAVKFNISQSAVSRYVISWANFLYCVLGSQYSWPTKDQLKLYMPRAFYKHDNMTAIINATELRVQIPSGLLLNSELYSNYKSSTTLKCFIGIAPWGAVTFVSSVHVFRINFR